MNTCICREISEPATHFVLLVLLILSNQLSNRIVNRPSLVLVQKFKEVFLHNNLLEVDFNLFLVFGQSHMGSGIVGMNQSLFRFGLNEANTGSSRSSLVL